MKLNKFQQNDERIYQIDERSEPQDQLNFIKFETKYIETMLDFVKENLITRKDFKRGKHIKVTGGGAYKYKDVLTAKLGVK